MTRHPRLALIEALIKDNLPDTEVHAWIIENCDWYNLVVTVTSDTINECFLSESCLSASEAMENLLPLDIVKWIKLPIRSAQ